MKQLAKIVQIKGDNLVCEIECADACAGCGSKSLCGGGGTAKQVTLINTGRAREVGEQIELQVSSTTGLWAVAIAYLIPVVIIIATLLILQALQTSELAQGLGTIGVVMIYYIAIKFFGIGRSISITIVE